MTCVLPVTGDRHLPYLNWLSSTLAGDLSAVLQPDHVRLLRPVRRASMDARPSCRRQGVITRVVVASPLATAWISCGKDRLPSARPAQSGRSFALGR